MRLEYDTVKLKGRLKYLKIEQNKKREGKRGLDTRARYARIFQMEIAFRRDCVVPVSYYLDKADKKTLGE